MQAQNTQIRTALIPNVIKPTSAHIGGSARVLPDLLHHAA
jgi:hypothetical protein